MKSSGSDILVGTLANDVFVRVEGKGTHANSQPLREFLFGMIDRGYRRYQLDLQNCSYMDSTFLGTLVGVCLRLRKVPEGRFTIVNANQRSIELFQTLGIEHFFQIDSQGRTDNAPSGQQLQSLPQGPDSKQQRAETMLEAHENLARASADNVPRFKDCIEFLKEDLARMKAESDTAGK